MSLDAAAIDDLHTAHAGSSRVTAIDPAACILKHAVKIWARDQGIAETDLPRLTSLVLDFANTAIRDCERRLHVVV
jgi:hypothetical protein